MSRALGVGCAVFTFGVGVVALIGWALDLEPLKTLFLGNISIKTNTAISLTCLGLSLLCLAPVPRPRWQLMLGRALAIVPTVIGLLTLSEHLLGWNLGIDQLLFAEPLGAAATASPNRMGPPASVSLPLLGVALLLIDSETPRGRAPGQVLAMVAILIAFIPVLGFINDVRELYSIARFTGIAPATAFGLLVMPFGILLSRPEVGWMRRVFADDAGGFVLRRLIPASVFLPIFIGRLRAVGQDAGFYDADFGRSLATALFIAAFSMITWWTAATVRRHAVARERAEAAEHVMHQRLLVTLESERHARAMAERSNRMKDEFLATLSHELRTPLQAMLGWAHVLGQTGVETADAKRGLQAIERNARLQAQLIDDLLDMSRIESGKVRLDVQDVDLRLVIESALAAAAPGAAARGLSIEREIDSDVAVVRGDPARLQQVLWNLISNALKFTQPGGRITVSLRRTPGHVELAVADTGIGISGEFLGQVFDRFRQADPSTTRRHGGLGLGLTIARHLTDLHGGTLEAASDGLNRGATFTVRLPHTAPVAVEAAMPVRPATLEPAVTDAAAVSLAGVRILVVDDQPDACELMERLLRDCGATVATAPTVDAAIADLSRDVFDVLVSDISMPERDGYDLIRHVRSQQLAMPAIALTAFAREEDAQRALAAGFDRHVAKPVTAAALIGSVLSLVENSARSSVA